MAVPATAADRVASDALRGGLVAETPALRLMVEHGNDMPFGSDGGGASFHGSAALRRGPWFAAATALAVTPELKRRGDVRSNDPLRERGRLVAFVGRHGARGSSDASVALRGGLAGGAADRAVHALQKKMHAWAGVGDRGIHDIGPTRPIAGVDGHWRVRARDGAFGPGLRVGIEPYAFGSAGRDVAEAGAGLMVFLQRDGAEAMSPWRPDTGAYAPLFGGNGVALFAAARAIAHDDLYGGRTGTPLARTLIASAGAVAQASVGPAVFGVRAACSTGAYRGGPARDCYAVARGGVRF